MQKIYSRINWENFPSEKTAVNESNLNKMDLAIDNLDDRVVSMDASKVDLTKANELVEEILWDESNGTLTVVKMNGSRAVIDTKLEKLAVNFTYNPQTQQLVITLDDGTVQNVDLSSLITEYEFLDSDTIAFEIVDGKVKAKVKNGSITEDHLSPDYLGEIRTQVGRAEMSAKSADASEKSAASSSTLSKSYAVGGTGTRDGEDTDNAKYYAEQAKNASDVGALSEIVENHISDKIVHMTESEHDVVSKLGESAEGSLTYNGSEIKPSVATTESTGVVKPDGKSMSVDESGTLSINLDGTTITLDEAKNVIKLADTLKDAINGAFPAANVANNQITTVEGFALDARQANPNIDGSLAKQISDLNGSLIPNTNALFTGEPSDYFEIQYLRTVKIGNFIIASITIHILSDMVEWVEYKIATANSERIKDAGVGFATSQNTGKVYTLTGGGLGYDIDIRADINPPQNDDWLRGSILFYQY